MAKVKVEVPELVETTITCACGAVLKTLSTKEDLKVDTCSQCHPFWSGSKQTTAKGGRADKFRAKYGLDK